MSYNLSLLTTVSDCIELVQEATNERSGLVIHKSQIEHNIQTETDIAISVPKELEAIELELSAAESAYGILPEGKIRVKYEANINSLKNKKIRLMSRAETYGALAMLDKQLEVEKLGKEIEVLDAYIAAVETRKLELAA